MEYDNTNSGALFKNDKKETEKQPDYKGKLNVKGKDFYLSAWIKTSKEGNKYMSLAVQEPTQGHQSTKQKETIMNMKDDIPF